MKSMKIVQFSRPASPLCPCTYKIFPPFCLWGSNFKRMPPLQIITNQLKVNIIKGWLLYVIKSFIQVGFRFHSLILSGFPLTSFHPLWFLFIKPHYLPFLGLYSCMCSCPKILQNVFYLQLFIFLVLTLNQTVFFAQVHRACERPKSKRKQNQVTSHSNCPRVLLFDLAHKQWSGIIKGWLHCLTSESKVRFLVNIILAQCPIMA